MVLTVVVKGQVTRDGGAGGGRWTNFKICAKNRAWPHTSCLCWVACTVDAAVVMGASVALSVAHATTQMNLSASVAAC